MDEEQQEEEDEEEEEEECDCVITWLQEKKSERGGEREKKKLGLICWNRAGAEGAANGSTSSFGERRGEHRTLFFSCAASAEVMLFKTEAPLRR